MTLGAPAAGFQLTTVAPVVAGNVGSGTATAMDAYGYSVPDYNAAVQVISSDPAAVCTATKFVGGQAPFRCTFKTAGTQTVQLKDAAGINGVVNVTVTPAATTAYATSLPPLAVAGSAVSGSAITMDSFGNPTTDYNGAAQVISSDAGAICSTAKMTSGKGSYTCTFKTLGAQTITVQDASGVLSKAQANVTVLANPLLTATPGRVGIADSLFAGSKDVQLTSTTPGVAFTAVADSPWLHFTVSAGTTPAVLHVTGDKTGLTVGNYQGGIVVAAPNASNSPYVIPVTFTEGTDPPGQTVISSAASLMLTATAPNSILTLFAPSLSCPDPPQVLVNGAIASVLYAGTSQINLVVPGEVTGTTAAIQVLCDGTPLAKVTTLLAAAVPALFTQTQSGSGQASIVNADGTINAAGNPALRGGYVSVFGSGFGALNAASSDGLRRLAGTVTATIGGTTASVLYAGEAPGFTSGLQQINVQLPPGLPTGLAVPIVLTVNNVATQSGTTMALQ